MQTLSCQPGHKASNSKYTFQLSIHQTQVVTIRPGLQSKKPKKLKQNKAKQKKEHVSTGKSSDTNTFSKNN